MHDRPLCYSPRRRRHVRCILKRKFRNDTRRAASFPG
jgi:hypothetical protein